MFRWKTILALTLVGLLTLSGCGQAETANMLASTVESVDGVESAELRIHIDGGFKQLLYGEIVLDASDDASARKIYEEAMLTLAQTLSDSVENGENRGVGGVKGVRSDGNGEELDITDLGLHAARIEIITASALLERYS